MAKIGNKVTRSLDMDEYKEIIDTILHGFTYTDKGGHNKTFRGNPRLAMILQVEAVCGLRVGDILGLRLCDIIKDGKHYRLDIVEQKTGKSRIFTVSDDMYKTLWQWALERHIGATEPLFSGANGKTPTVRAVQKQLKIVADYLGMDGISTHSFRKTFARAVYEDSGYDVELVRELLQHSTTGITQRYLGIGSKRREAALQGTSDKFLIK